ncbi:MAG TPA: hypothetical protein VN363_08335 [Anaerolineales bacterium]|nr:hypothetical protein [Anaerolineales bacterium]
MAFRCPQCKTPASLGITSSIELPPDSRSDEITLQVVECSACGFGGLAVYEEHRHAIQETDDWNHIGYWVSQDAVESVKEAIRSCPNPLQAQCKCSVHSSLSQRDIYGVWKGLLELERGHTFLMRMATAE